MPEPGAMCEDDDCTDDAEVLISYKIGKRSMEELFCEVHGAARMKALTVDPTINSLETADYDADEDEDEDEDDEDEDEDDGESA